MKKLIKNLSNIKDAIRVLEIMDKAGVDIEQVEGFEGSEKYWRIKPKWYVSEQQAKDLKTIVLHKEHYTKSSRLFHKLFYKNTRYGYRDFYN